MASLRGEKIAESSISLFESYMGGRCYIKVIENAVILKVEKAASGKIIIHIMKIQFYV